MDYKALAKQFGAIDGANQPMQEDWMGGLSPKDQAELKMEMYKRDRKRIDDLGFVIDNAAPTLNDLERFGQLNRESATGGFWSNVLPNWKMIHGPEHDEMQSIQNRLGPGQRVPGSGASSDRDVQLFLSGVPSPSQEGPTNKNIRQNFINNYNYAIDKKNAMERYLRENGTLMGFDTQWSSGAPKSPQKQQMQQGPMKGQVVDGYKFMGGNPADPNSWVKQ